MCCWVSKDNYVPVLNVQFGAHVDVSSENVHRLGWQDVVVNDLLYTQSRYLLALFWHSWYHFYNGTNSIDFGEVILDAVWTKKKRMQIDYAANAMNGATPIYTTWGFGCYIFYKLMCC